jgi:glutathione S-transferase
LPKLHDYVLSAECYSVRLMLALLGVAYERVAVDAYPGGAEAPVFEDGSTRLTDPGMILAYLARAHAPDRWLPQERAEAIAGWLAFALTELGALNGARKVATLGAAGDVDVLNRKGRLALRRVEDQLTMQGLDGHDWVTGASPTIADVALFPPIMLSHDGGIGLEDYPAINLWQRRLRRLPGFVGMPGIPDYF